MAVSADNLAKISEVINAINTKIRNPIQSKIVWHKGNLPPNFDKAPASWRDRFASYSGSLAGVSIPKGNVDTLAYFNNVYNGIVNAFGQWSQVRKCTFTYNENYWTNSNTPGWRTYTYTNVAFLSSRENGIINGIKNRRNYVNTLLKATDFNTFLDELFNIWNNLKDVYGAGGSQWTYSQPCHSSCHSDCHKSGGRR